MLLTGILVCFQIGFISSQWITSGSSNSQRGSNNNQRGPKTVVKCYKDMNKENNIAHLLLDIDSPQKLEQFCRKISDLMKCIAENEHHLPTSENTSYLRFTRGVYQFYLNVCPPGTEITAKYKEYSPCFQTMKDEILTCGSNIPSMSSPEMQNDKTRCCTLKDYRDCMTAETNHKCGEEASEIMEKIILRYFQVELSTCESISIDECHIVETTPERKVTQFYHEEESKKWPDYRLKTTLPDYPQEFEDKWKKEKKHNGGSSLFPSSLSMIGITGLLAFLQLLLNI